MEEEIIKKLEQASELVSSVVDKLEGQSHRVGHDSKRRMLYEVLNNLRIAGGSLLCAETHLKQQQQEE